MGQDDILRARIASAGSHWYGATPLGIWDTKDDPMVLIAYQPKDFATLCDVLGTQHWLAKDSIFRNSPARVARRGLLPFRALEVQTPSLYSVWISTNET